MKFPDKELQNNRWYIMATALIVVVIAWPLLRSGNGEAIGHAPSAQAADLPDPAAMMNRERAPGRTKEEEKVRAEIARQQALVEEDPQSPEAAAYLNSSGNLYRQKLRDYNAAAEAYQRIILDYPNWEGIYAVYPQLEVCYQELDDMESLRWLYQLMMQRHSPESDAYKYAQEQLRQR